MLTLNLLNAALLLLGFTLLWLWCQRLRNASWVDVAWAFGMLLPLAHGLMWRPPHHGPVWALVLLATAWSLRLGIHLLHRVLRLLPQEDSRYASLRQRWGSAAWKWWLLFGGQVAVILVLVQPWLLLLWLDPAQWAWPQWLGAGLVLLGIGGETLADWQLHQFLKRPKVERGDGVCRVGLWSCSRHPNYFFEALSWGGFWLYALVRGAPLWPWLGCVSAPLLMLWLLLKVTGLPAAERSSLRSKPVAFRRYQREVSAFIPWPPQRLKRPESHR